MSPWPSTLLLFLVRALLFILGRRFLLRALYSDIRHIAVPQSVSGDGTPMTGVSTPMEADESEVEMLPVPVSAEASPTTSMNRRAEVQVQPHITHSGVARTTFLLTFTESCTLFVLVIFHAADILDTSARIWNFHLSLLTTSALVLLIAPLLEIELLTSSSRRTSLFLRVSGVLGPYALYLLCLWRVPLPAAMHTTSFFLSLLARLALLGTLVLAVLSALGSLETSASFIASLHPSYWEPMHPDDIAHTESSLKRVRADMDERRHELRDRERSALENPQSSQGFLGRMFGRDAREDSSLRRELSALAQLEANMSMEVEALRQRKERLEWSKTWGGRVGVGIGRAFGVYCVGRILSVAANIALSVFLPSYRSASPASPSHTPDITTYLLASLLASLPFAWAKNIDRATLGRQISLLGVGAVVGGNLRLGVGAVARAVRLTSRNRVAGFVLLVLSQIMGMYLLSTLVQLRSSLPPSTGESEKEQIFALLPEFEVFGPLFDWVFMGTCVLWGVGRVGRGVWG